MPTADILAGRQHLTFGWRAATDPDFLRPYYHSKFIGHQLNRARFKDAEPDQFLIQGAQEQTRRAQRPGHLQTGPGHHPEAGPRRAALASQQLRRRAVERQRLLDRSARVLSAVRRLAFLTVHAWLRS